MSDYIWKKASNSMVPDSSTSTYDQHHTQTWLGSIHQPSFPLAMDRIHDEGEAAGKRPVWQRVKWTDPMVRLLITIVSYIGEPDTASSETTGYGARRKMAMSLQRKGKWKTVSKVMAERGLYASPQQCEDKLNDLTKRYKKLNDIVGWGASCQVVENPALLNMMDHLSDKAKDEVRKILSSKQLFYEEMCSYYNGNRLHLPPDPALQRSLQSALIGSKDEIDEDELVRQEYEEKPYIEDPAKKARLRVAQLEDQKMQIEMEMMELERKRFEWKKLSRKEARELEKPKMENERMRLENEQMALELKQMEMSINR